MTGFLDSLVSRLGFSLTYPLLRGVLLDGLETGEFYGQRPEWAWKHLRDRVDLINKTDISFVASSELKFSGLDSRAGLISAPSNWS